MVIRAYALIMEHGKAGETYNVGSGHAVSIQEILDTIVSFSKADIKVEVDPAKLATGRCADHRGGHPEAGGVYRLETGDSIRAYDRRDIRLLA